IARLDASGQLTPFFQGNVPGSYVVPGPGPALDFYVTDGIGDISRVRADEVSLLYALVIPDNGDPQAGLILGHDGLLYGTTAGLEDRELFSGSVFRMDTAGQFKTLHSFDWATGGVPQAPLMEAPDGNFYGTTLVGGEFDGGMLFRMDSSGSVS